VKRDSRFTRSIALVKLRILFLIGLVAAVLVVIKEQFAAKPSPPKKNITEKVEVAQSVLAIKTSPIGAPVAVAAEPVSISHEDFAVEVSTLLKEWDEDDDPALRPERLRKLNELLSGTNTLQIIQGLPTELMGYVFAVSSVREKLSEDPEASLEWMSQHPNTRSQLFTLLHDCAAKDPDAIQQYLDKLPDSEWKQKVLSSAANEALSRQPETAISIAAQMDPGPQRVQWLTSAAAEWARQNPGAAAQWANQTGDAGLRDQLIASVAMGAVEQNPEEAANFLFQNASSENFLNQSLGKVIWSWSLKDPDAAAGWMMQFPDSLLRDNMLKELMPVWGTHQPEAATSWVEQLPAGAFQIRAARELYSVFQAQ